MVHFVRPLCTAYVHFARQFVRSLCMSTWHVHLAAGWFTLYVLCALHTSTLHFICSLCTSLCTSTLHVHFAGGWFTLYVHSALHTFTLHVTLYVHFARQFVRHFLHPLCTSTLQLGGTSRHTSRNAEHHK